jgi:hypothetical membrane protein
MWVGTLQFFLVETAVQSRWVIPYDRRNYYISDLGALHCATVDAGRDVCSPWHAAMNASFVVQGLLISGGAVLLRPMWRQGLRGRKAAMTTALLVTAGAGVALVGLAPEDAAPSVHVLGAVANFTAGNAGLIMLALSGAAAGDSVRWPHVLTAGWAGVLGTVGLAALASFVAGAHWGLGVGGIERVIAYPLPAALPVVAVGLLWAVRGRRSPALGQPGGMP